ncbi:hypothetical protein SADUNF_Sadunf01G0002200 [Salix dunnii]|uniref:Protein kinase domain-containing protein n=1 Tax=Salix dunnii TaxID=1413687 RepID=A0A835N926_9ROSI|nr:hypothetical protein SADUNF_Sadunf01G0002200 [Salix dunnii]
MKGKAQPKPKCKGDMNWCGVGRLKCALGRKLRKAPALVWFLCVSKETIRTIQVILFFGGTISSIAKWELSVYIAKLADLLRSVWWFDAHLKIKRYATIKGCQNKFQQPISDVISRKVKAKEQNDVNEMICDLEDYNAKLSDFGLAKDGPMVDNSWTNFLAASDMFKPLTPRSDVYSFGVVLLELPTEKKKLLNIVDPRLEGNYPIKGFQKAAMLAYHCLNRNLKARPLMQEILDSSEPLQELEDVPNKKDCANCD